MYSLSVSFAGLTRNPFGVNDATKSASIKVRSIKQLCSYRAKRWRPGCEAAQRDTVGIMMCHLRCSKFTFGKVIHLNPVQRGVTETNKQ